MSIKEQAKRNNFLDILRFVAALMVCLFHFNESIPYKDNFYRQLIKHGWVGVPLFFLISGYCILITLNRSKNIKEFLVKRLLRIFPPYWLSIVVTLIVILVYKVVTGNNSLAILPKSGLSIISTALLLTEPASNIKTINWVYWSLTYELFFYIVSSLALILSPKTRIFFFIILSAGPFLFGEVAHSPLFFFSHWSTFGLGLALYYFEINKGDVLELIKTTILFSINFLGLIAAPTGNSFEYKITAIVSIVLVSLSSRIKIRKGLFTKLGEYSYSTYLFHVPLGVFFIQQLKYPLIQDQVYFNIVFDLLTYLFVLAFSSLTFKYVEGPFIALGKKYSKTS